MNKKIQCVEINTLSEYINCVANNGLDTYISRGENQRFDYVAASAFRYDTPIQFTNMIEQFYSIIGNNLTNMQKEHFVAFSQHHGIPTNLVDFSTSPLVSLFFSCYETAKSNSDSGYVYFINNNRLIDINNMMNYTNYKNNILSDLLNLEPSILSVIIKLYSYEHTHIHEIEQIIIDCTNKLKTQEDVRNKYAPLFDIVKEMNNCINTNKYEDYFPLHLYSDKILKTLIDINKDDSDTDFILYKEDVNEYYKLIKDIRIHTQFVYFDDVLLILMLIKTMFGELIDFCMGKKILTDFYLPFYFSYSPPNIISRVSNQSSLFIYQLYYDNNLPDRFVEKVEDRLCQSIVPDFMIKINNKQKMLESLDAVGINLKFIYNDYDNIAKYVKDKFLKLN